MEGWPDWAVEVFQENRIIPEKLSGILGIKKLVIGFDSMATTPQKIISAKQLLLNQPNVIKYLERQRTDQSLLAAGKEEEIENKLETAPETEKTEYPRSDQQKIKKIKLEVNGQPKKPKTEPLIKSENVPTIKKEQFIIDAPKPEPVVKEEKPVAEKAPVVWDNADDEIPNYHNYPYVSLAPNSDELVTFGMIKSNIAAAQLSIMHSLFANGDTQLLLGLVAEPSPQANVYLIRIDTQDKRTIGYVEKKISCILSPLLADFDISGIIRKPATANQNPIFHILICGRKKKFYKLGHYLSSYKVYLLPPTIAFKYPYHNPHAGMPAQKQEYLQIGQQQRSADEVKNQIDSIYNTLISAEDLPEMEPDSRLITPLYPHQKQALHFMMSCEHPEESNGGGLWKKHLNGEFENLITGETFKEKPKFHSGGILADDMGLGKTIEVISVMLKTYQESNNWLQDVKLKTMNDDLEDIGFDPALLPAKGTLIVCPLSTVSNWEDQIQNHVRRGALSVYVYHGASRCQDPRILSKFNVVLTTYNVVSLEYGKDLRNFKRTVAESKSGQKVPVSMMSSILHKMHWFRIVLDEAHIIKDTNTGQSKAVCAMSAESRWCLTGTPIQNKLDDIYSLVNFLGIEPFCSKMAWNTYITRGLRQGTSQGGNSIGVARLQTLMKSVTLRRTKQSKIKGKPILSLPPRNDTIHYLTLDETEQLLYDRAYLMAQTVFKNFEKEGSVLRHYVHLLEKILKLRQICTHPLLCKDYEELIKQDDSDSKWNLERATHSLGLLKDSGDEDCCMCGIYIDGIEFSPNVSKCGHLYCENCVKSGFSKGASISCGMCQTQLVRSDIILVSEQDQDEDSIKKKPEPGIIRLQTGDPSSSKVRALLQDLNEARLEGSAVGQIVKSVIFSQWTQMLDLIERPLLKAGYRIVRLDGRMARPERTLSMERFKKDPNITIMLVSLKAGGVGLNLTSASRVYIMEPYWNPAIEQQAIDRVHRLGQKNPVTTVRFIVTGTIEDAILELQRKKLQLAQLTFKEDQADLAAIDRHKKMKRADAKKDKEAAQSERLDDLRLLFNIPRVEKK